MQSSEVGLRAPPIAALFVTTFDTRIGYTLTWNRAQIGIDLEGQVEYKSLPSGLHKLEKDLIYFTHGGFTGLSAFQRSPAGHEERHARFVAVGVLVPLSTGKIGRAWMHAEGLRNLASRISQEGINEECLERAWEDHRLNVADNTCSDPRESGYRDRSTGPHDGRRRTMSDATGAIFNDALLDIDHPALSMCDFIDAFGPLCFVIQRAALLRRRLLIVGEPPVQRICDFVYALCMFSSITSALNQSLKLPPSLQRTEPLFNVGVHDIPDLVRYKSGKEGFLACTTDRILTSKHDLYDIRIEMKKAVTSDGSAWPEARTSDGLPIKATQRDLRRFRFLRRELDRIRHARIHRAGSISRDRGRDARSVQDDAEPLITGVQTANSLTRSHTLSIAQEDCIVEQPSWASIAYTSMLWWASSGQVDLAWEEEAIQDAALLEDLTHTDSRRDERSGSPAHGSGSHGRRRRNRSGTSLSPARGRSISSRRRSLGPEAAELERRDRQAEAMLLTAFFHRLTALYLETLSELLYPGERSDEGDDGDSVARDQDEIAISGDDMTSMGLDMWSPADCQFVTDMAQRLFLQPRRDSRRVAVTGSGVGPITICGVRIC